MTFWLVLLVLGFIASLFVVMPFFMRAGEAVDDRDDLNVDLYRDRVEDIQQSEIDNPDMLEREAQLALLEDTRGGSGASEAPPQAGVVKNTRSATRVMLGFALALPFIALFIYHESGLNQGAIPDVRIAQALEQLSPDDEAGYKRITELLADRLESKPDDSDLKFLLASAYANQGRFNEAGVHYGELVAEFPHDASLASRYAEVLFIADGRRLTPRAVAAVDIALGLNPMDVTMLEVRAIGSMMDGNTVDALKWFNLALQTGIDGRRAELIRQAVQQIESATGMQAPEHAPGVGPLANHSAAPAADSPNDVSQAGREIVVHVTADPSGNVSAQALVFIYARAANGPRAPLAVQRFPVSALPLTVKLDETMAMMPGMGLANFDEVVVIARISNSGQVVPAPGDHEAKSAVLTLSDERLTVELHITEQM